MSLAHTGTRIFTLTCLFLSLLVLPATAKVAVFNQQDIARLTEIHGAIQSLMQDVDVTLKSVPSYESGKIQAYAIIELILEAARERLGCILLLVAASAEMEAWNDQARILNVLYGELLPKSKAYVTAKKNAIIRIASAESDHSKPGTRATRH
jgi:hypothetical protein